MAQTVLVKQYRTIDSYQRDAVLLGAQGWEVVTMTQSDQRAGCLRGCMLGPLALIWKPRPRFVATYRRTSGA